MECLLLHGLSAAGVYSQPTDPPAAADAANSARHRSPTARPLIAHDKAGRAQTAAAAPAELRSLAAAAARLMLGVCAAPRRLPWVSCAAIKAGEACKRVDVV